MTSTLIIHRPYGKQYHRDVGIRQQMVRKPLRSRSVGGPTAIPLAISTSPPPTMSTKGPSWGYPVDAGGRSWSHFVGICRQKSSKSSKSPERFSGVSGIVPGLSYRSLCQDFALTVLSCSKSLDCGRQNGRGGATTGRVCG